MGKGYPGLLCTYTYEANSTLPAKCMLNIMQIQQAACLYKMKKLRVCLSAFVSIESQLLSKFQYHDKKRCRFDSLSSELEDCSRMLTRGGVNYPAKLCFQTALMTTGKQWPGKPSMTAARTDEAIPSGGATESREKSHP